MDQRIKDEIMNNAREYMHAGWHCSEGILKAAGEVYFPEQLPDLLRIAAPFSGGVGGTKKELCGAFTGGLMVIGALHGRESAEENDDHCLELSASYRERFLDHFGSLQCQHLRDNWVGKPDQPDCEELTAHAAGLLAEILEK